MVDVNIKVTKGLEGLEDVIFAALTDRASIEAFRRRVIPLVEKQIEKAVTDTQDRFRPDRVGRGELIGQLGIGSDGREDTNKITNAWRLLIPTEADVAKISSSFARNVNKFGRISFTIDIDRFFNQELTTYTSEVRRGGVIGVQWMRHFIDGLEVQGHAFVDDFDPDFRFDSSRTGLGHMVRLDRVTIPRQQFELRGQGRGQTFGKLFENVERNLKDSSFQGRLAVVIARALGAL